MGRGRGRGKGKGFKFSHSVSTSNRNTDKTNKSQLQMDLDDPKVYDDLSFQRSSFDIYDWTDESQRQQRLVQYLNEVLAVNFSHLKNTDVGSLFLDTKENHERRIGHPTQHKFSEIQSSQMLLAEDMALELNRANPDLHTDRFNPLTRKDVEYSGVPQGFIFQVGLQDDFGSQNSELAEHNEEINSYIKKNNLGIEVGIGSAFSYLENPNEPNFSDENKVPIQIEISNSQKIINDNYENALKVLNGARGYNITANTDSPKAESILVNNTLATQIFLSKSYHLTDAKMEAESVRLEQDSSHDYRKTKSYKSYIEYVKNSEMTVAAVDSICRLLKESGSLKNPERDHVYLFMTDYIVRNS